MRWIFLHRYQSLSTEFVTQINRFKNEFISSVFGCFSTPNLKYSSDHSAVPPTLSTHHHCDVLCYLCNCMYSKSKVKSILFTPELPMNQTNNNNKNFIHNILNPNKNKIIYANLNYITKYGDLLIKKNKYTNILNKLYFINC